MKKTRVLAALLCLMMVICSLPMIQASAAVSDNLYDEIGKLMGRISSRAHNSATWSSMDLDFTNDFANNDNVSVRDSSGAAADFTTAGFSYDNTNGLNFPADNTYIWTYFPANLKSQGWCPLVYGAYTTRFKLDANGRLEFEACAYYNHGRSFVIATESGVTVFSSSDNETINSGQSVIPNTNEFAPGNDWIDMAVVANGGEASSANGYSVYMKKATDPDFTLVCSTASYRSNGGWKSTGFTVSGHDAHVAHAVMLEGSDTPLVEEEVIPSVEISGNAPTAAEMDAAGEVLGAASILPATDLAFDFVTAGTSYVQPAGVETATEITYAAEGLSFGATQGLWKYNPATKWCPFSYGDAIYFKGKVSDATGYIIAQAYLPTSDHYRMFYTITPTGVDATSASGVTVHEESFAPGNDYVEYIMLRDVSNSDAQVLYARGGNAAEWTKIVTATTWRNGGYNGGLSFTGINAVIPYAAVVKTSDEKQDNSSGGSTEPDESLKDDTPNPGITDGLRESIGAIFGKPYANPAVSSSDWAAMNLDFSGSFDATQDGVNTGEGITYDAVDGVVFPATEAQFRYRPTCKYNGWSPLCISNNYSFNFKLDPDGTFQTQAPKVWSGNDRVYIDFSNNGVTVWGRAEGTEDMGVSANLVDYKPGTSWNDVVIKANDNNGYDVYMKKATDTEFTLVNSTTTYRPGNAWNTGGFTINAKSAKMGYAVSWVGGVKAIEYDSIEQIMGGKVAATYALDFDSTFDSTYWKRQGSMTSPAGVTYSDENGLDMTTATEAVNWNFNAFSGWSPFSQVPPWASPVNYIPQAVYFKAKGKVNVQFRGPGNAGRFYIDVDANKVLGTGTNVGTSYYNDTVTTDNGWMEYLIVPNSDATSGYSFYAKGGSAAKWTKVADGTGWRTGGGNTTGISFYGNGGCVKSVRAYVLGAEDAATIPAAANVAWYEDDMNAVVSYGNVTTQANCVEGIAKFETTTETGSKKYALSDAEIPVGGYAEFKTRSNGNCNVAFGDGTNGGSFNTNKDYSDVFSGAGFGYFADSNNVWRTYRIVRSAEGYSVYSKVDGTDAWVEHIVNGSAASTVNGITLTFYIHQNGENAGTGQLDYLKIYAPAPEGDLALTDGYSTVAAENTEALKYSTPRALVMKGDKAKTLVFAEYDGNGLLVNAEYANIEAGTGSVSVPYEFADEANTVRLFYWDAATQANLNDDMILTME